MLTELLDGGQILIADIAVYLDVVLDRAKAGAMMLGTFDGEQDLGAYRRASGDLQAAVNGFVTRGDGQPLTEQNW